MYGDLWIEHTVIMKTIESYRTSKDYSALKRYLDEGREVIVFRQGELCTMRYSKTYDDYTFWQGDWSIQPYVGNHESFIPGCCALDIEFIEPNKY